MVGFELALTDETLGHSRNQPRTGAKISYVERRDRAMPWTIGECYRSYLSFGMLTAIFLQLD